MNLRNCYNFDDFRNLAKKKLPSPIFHYIDGGSDDESTLKRNTASFDDCDLVPNVCSSTILPYIEIQPSKSKKLSDSRLILIGNILTQLEKKKYKEAVKSIKSIEENKNYFNSTIKQLLIAIEFKNTIEEFISYG